MPYQLGTVETRTWPPPIHATSPVSFDSIRGHVLITLITVETREKVTRKSDEVLTSLPALSYLRVCSECPYERAKSKKLSEKMDDEDESCEDISI